ncbi:cobalt-precorrin-6A reductase [Aphanothece hegewaldii CCALA 016]|uniref:Cobalt-precorrin-6A reductase n=1 Tax=Aphanothece hegewaldii CCALA 016 TaxID=2107694 RepID=A0A2T1LV81_9CHRO|nr:cobalt-precorrin-6A reductase [Aphanothece hegewaldii]PSF35585.1 cobalt-precorrin-6A reductase [Aphanothece hegewaldii CCALA 016]
MSIWLIGGTSDSAILAVEMATHAIPCIVTVTTQSAKNLYPESPLLTVKIGKPDQSEKITAIVDASHPYATEISRIAIDLANQNKIPYLRYERPKIEDHSVNEIDIETLLQGDYLSGQRVLLTIGYKTLPLFQPWQNRATLYTRILPVVNSLLVANAAGFSPDRIIALRPPISPELEKALWLQWKISLVVTKASGREGGEDIKRLVAKELNIPLLVIARPKIFYPQQTSKVSQVIAFCRQHYKIK